LCPCATCADSDTPHTFRYQSVLNAKEQKQTLQCNESFTAFKAEDILKGVYDETTVLVDSLKGKKNEHSSILALIKADKLDEAIAAITSPKYNALFDRRLKDLNRNSISGILTFEQKSLARNALAKELVEYLTSDRWQEKQKLERLGDMSPTDMEAFPSGGNRKYEDRNEADSDRKKEPPVQIIINNTPAPATTPAPAPVTEIPLALVDEPPSIPEYFYKKWWFERIIGAILVAGVVGYFANKYGDFHFGDTWLGVASLGSLILLWRNPKRVYLRWAGFCVMAIAGINILSQIDVAFKIADATKEARPWDLLFKLGFGEEPILSVILGILALVLFVLDYRVRKEKL
jgi:hypothetical protein